MPGPADRLVPEIQTCLELLHEPGSVFEVRALGVPDRGRTCTVSGYFNDFGIAARTVARLTFRKPAGVYVTVNPCDPALLARAANRIIDWPKHTTQDSEILRRRWLFLDIDPVRPSGIPATDTEVDAARNLAAEIEDLLRSRGWGVPLSVESGNGMHLLYGIDLPNDVESSGLIRDCYVGLTTLIPPCDPTKLHATLDTSVYNAARLCRVGGTMNRKGDSTPDHPHRRVIFNEPDPDQPVEVVPAELLRELAALAPAADGQSRSSGKLARPSTNGTTRSGNSGSRLLVERYLAEHSIEFKVKRQANGTAYVVACPFGPHGANGETAVFQRSDGLVCFQCKHDSCQDRRWADYRDMIGKPDPERHYDPPLSPGRGNVTTGPKASLPPIPAGTVVYAGDRSNYGTMIADHGDTCTVHFRSPEGQEAIKELPKFELRSQNGQSLGGTANAEIILPPPMTLEEMIRDYPQLRPPVVEGLLRRGETMNIIAAPKQGKSWLAHGLAFAVVDGFAWLDTFQCERGRVLVIDGELHPETISHRLPVAAAAMGMTHDYRERLEVWALRSKGMNLANLGDSIRRLEPDRYALVILDAWYRFLPPGISENDNAAIMGLYNLIDEYSSHLNAAWVNIHHTSKGDQSMKGTTDVGSGAGAQSRAADSHLVIRPHEEDGVAVVDIVTRSWPPVDSFAIRWDYPLWFLDRLADPQKLKRPGAEKQAANDAAAKVEIVGALETYGSMTARRVRNRTTLGQGRVDRILPILVREGLVVGREETIRGNVCMVYSLPPHR
jgi:hypothetical protein